MILRAARQEDLPAILAVYNDAVLHSTAIYRYDPVTLAERSEWLAARHRQGLPVLVCEAEGKPVAFATYGPFRPYPASQYAVEHSVYVGRGYRRRHIGTRLMEELIRLADRRYAVMVGVIDSENTESIRLHRKLGFVYAGTVRRAGFKFGRWLDLRFYQRLLTGPALPGPAGATRGESNAISTDQHV